jgi:hypothetical protein
MSGEVIDRKVKMQSVLMSYLDCDDPEIVDMLYSVAWADFPTDEQVKAAAKAIYDYEGGPRTTSNLARAALEAVTRMIEDTDAPER